MFHARHLSWIVIIAAVVLLGPVSAARAQQDYTIWKPACPYATWDPTHREFWTYEEAERELYKYPKGSVVWYFDEKPYWKPNCKKPKPPKRYWYVNLCCPWKKCGYLGGYKTKQEALYYANLWKKKYGCRITKYPYQK